VLRLAICPSLRLIACAACSLIVASLSGCAAVKAARQPDKKNLGVLHEGTPRAQVIAELGAPTYTKPKPDGTVEDVFSFKQGYSKGVKMTRAFGHAAADVATGGLWEVVGIPAEIWADGTEVQVLVTYDQDERVRYRRVFKGQEVFGERAARRQSVAGRRTKATQVAKKPPSSQQAADGPSDRKASDTPDSDRGASGADAAKESGSFEGVLPASATSDQAAAANSGS
jgi:outer membrane protein assembly factor BamE (lipoprotein component of BamABCDE complex)